MGALARANRKAQNGERVPSIFPEGATAPSVAAQGAPAKSAGGWFGNLVEDFGELAQGVGHLGGSVLNDFVGAVQSPFRGSEADFRLDDLVKQLGFDWEGLGDPEQREAFAAEMANNAHLGPFAPFASKRYGRALKDDYSDRYGMLLPGGRPASEFGDTLYEDPLSVLLDVADVATLGGTAAVHGAQAASKAGNVSADLARIARLERLGVKATGGAGWQPGRTARVVDKIIPGRKYQLIGEDAPLGGTFQRVTSRGETIDVESSLNPIRRATVDKVRERIYTRPIERLMNEFVDNPLDDATRQADAAETVRSLNAAKEAGVGRVERQFITDARAKGLAKRILGRMTGTFVGRRDAAMGELSGILKRLPKEEADDFHLRLQGVLTTPNPAGRLDFDAIRTIASEPKSQRQSMVADVIRDDLARIDELTDPLEQEAGRRYIEQVAGEPLAAELAGVVDPMADVMDDVQLWVHRHLTKPKIEKGLPYTNVLDRAFQPQRQVMGATFDKSLGRFVDPDDASEAVSFRYDDAVKNQGHKAPVYFPHEEPLRATKADFLTTQRVSGMRKAARDPGELRSEGVLFDRHLKGQADAYVKDPAEAYSRRAAQAIRQQEVGEGIAELVTTLGRTVTARDQVASSERVVNLDAVKWMTRSRISGREAIEDALAAGTDLDEAIFGAAKKTMPTNPEEVAALFDADASLYALPKVAIEKIEAYQKGRLGGSEKYARLFWDSPMNAWRAGALYLSPRFYLNNVLGDTTFLKLQGGKLAGVIKQASPKYREALRQAIGDEALQQIEGHGFFSSTSQRATYPGASRPERVVHRARQTKVAKGSHWITDRLRRFNEAIENAYRRESYVTGVEHQLAKKGVKKAGHGWYRSYQRLNQISEHGASPSTMRNALDEMNRTMNDYAALGPLERNIVRRFVFPFWGFYKHASKTLITMPWKHPVKATLLDKIAEIDQEMKDDLGPMPDWLDDYLPVGVTPLGETSFLSTRGANPFSGVGENSFAMTNPLLQTIYEQTTGRDVFSDRPFSSPDVVTPSINERPMRAVKDANGNIIGVEETKVKPSLAETFIQTLPMGDMAADLIAGGARYTGGGGAIPDETGAPAYPFTIGDALSKWGGVSTIDFNLPEYQEQLRGDEQEALRLLLSRIGG